MLFLCVIWFPMISCIYILDAHGTWLNQGWKNTPLPQPVLKHLNTRMASSPWWMPNTASNTCMKRNPKGLRMKQWSSWPLQIASLSTRQTWSESLVGMWQIFPPSSLILWMVWCHLCDCKFVFGERIAVHRSQRPSFQSSLERFERSMVLHPWSTLRAMFASGWIVAVWCFDSEISSCRATLKIFQDNARKSSSIKVRKGVQTAVNSTEAFVLDSPRNSKVQVQEIMGTSSWVKKKKRYIILKLRKPIDRLTNPRCNFSCWANRWGIKGFSLDRVLESDAEFLSDQDHQHDQSVSSAFRLGFRRRLVGIGRIGSLICNLGNGFMMGLGFMQWVKWSFAK